MSNQIPTSTSYPANQPLSPVLDKPRLPTTYTNVFRAGSSAEELILDFGLDAHRRTADGGEPAVMLQRLVLTWSHAKRLALVLRGLVQMQEQNHAANPPAPPT